MWTLTINRPEVHNCVDGETAVAIAESIESFKEDREACVLVVTGAGSRAFCVGADLKDPAGLMEHRFSQVAGPMGFARLDPDKPTVAAIEGYCFAGGLELAAWCDFRIAAEGAQFGALNRRWGVPFIDGGTQRFARIVGFSSAMYMIETGVRFDASKALQMGFVQEVVDDGTALARARELAGAIASYPQQSIRSDRRAVIEGIGRSLDQAIVRERELGVASLSDPELAKGLIRFASGDRPESPTV